MILVTEVFFPKRPRTLTYGSRASTVGFFGVFCNFFGAIRINQHRLMILQFK